MKNHRTQLDFPVEPCTENSVSNADEPTQDVELTRFGADKSKLDEEASVGRSDRMSILNAKRNARMSSGDDMPAFQDDFNDNLAPFEDIPSHFSPYRGSSVRESALTAAIEGSHVVSPPGDDTHSVISASVSTL